MTQINKDNLSAVAMLLLALATVWLSRALGPAEKTWSGDIDAPCESALSAKLPPAAWSGALIERVTLQRERATTSADTPAHMEQLGWTFARIARLADDRAYFELASAAAQCMESKDPDSLGALLLRGHIAHNQHRFYEAETAARQLVRKRGAWFDYALLGDALIEQGHVEEGAAAWQKMMDLRPGPQAYARAAHLRRLEGDVDGAIDMALRAAQSTSARNPLERARAHADLAAYLLLTQQNDAARRAVNIALAIAPGEPRARALNQRFLAGDFRVPAEIDLSFSPQT